MMDIYEDDEYYELLRECYEKCKLPKEQGQKCHKWRCIYCEEVFQCRSFNVGLALTIIDIKCVVLWGAV